MKKIIPVFMSLVMVWFCACSAGGKTVSCTPELNRPFSSAVKIEYGDMESEAELHRYGRANWDASFNSPNTLAGVILSFRDDKVSASYKGLSFSVPKTALPVKSILSALIEAYDYLAEKEQIDVTEKDGFRLAEGELSQGKYTLKLDEKGVPAEFSMPNLELKITFSAFTSENTELPESTSSAVTEPASETASEPSGSAAAPTE